MIAIIVIAVIALVVIVGVVASQGDSSTQMHELDQRRWEAQRQVRDIGQRTREDIRAEALRRQRQGDH